MCLKRGTVSLYRYVALANSMIESTLPSAPFTLLKHDGAFLVETNTFARGAVTESKQQTTRGTTGQSLVSPEILKAMLPSREWKDENGKWQQNVSMEPSSRAEVLELQETLASNLVKEQAKQVGICANRERLHAQLFDEIIRQVTLACPERGLLLMRVRDEIRMTIAVYQALYNTRLSLPKRGPRKSKTKLQDLKTKLSN
ncbi:hypothetical protein, variant 1 [Aphanomyces invadans]|uniref:Dynein light chain n=2 Tax=Aphanomyces invadans TaxID=157072 RepID=A0A024UXY1_9STRA|nr:hypothetical protein, variant 1 [Aphanomyces invadans]ETW10568.1 hypothetical protein, variant 1 [Aphanomyces invadans]|eukprot:XP_008861979.1 hypothetical protein, variant 1 [Aphanomyces invadans]